MKRLDASFYRAPATVLAKELIGKVLCRRLPDGSVLRYHITETECYFGEEDTACHAHHGRTARTETLYAAGGVAYVYLCYGIHSLLNVVTGEKDHPEAVLIRGIDPVGGPGRVTKYMQISCALNGTDLTTSKELWLEDDGTAFSFEALPRVGIGYADEEDQKRLWRFCAG